MRRAAPPGRTPWRMRAAPAPASTNLKRGQGESAWVRMKERSERTHADGLWSFLLQPTLGSRGDPTNKKSFCFSVEIQWIFCLGGGLWMSNCSARVRVRPLSPWSLCFWPHALFHMLFQLDLQPFKASIIPAKTTVDEQRFFCNANAACFRARQGAGLFFLHANRGGTTASLLPLHISCRIPVSGALNCS